MRVPAPVRAPAQSDFWGACFACIRHDGGFHAFVAVYACLGLLAATAARTPHKFAPFTYASMYFSYSVQLAGCAAIIVAGICALRSREPFAALRRMAEAAQYPQLLAGALLFASVCLHMGVFTSTKTLLPDLVPFHADLALADLDDALHGGAPWHLTTALLPPDATAVIAPLYFGLWGLLLPSALLACMFVPRLRAVRAQYLWTYLIAWPLLGNVIAGAFMSAGPVFYGLVTGDTERFGGLLAYLSHFPPLTNGFDYLWQAHRSGQPGLATGISAFPSMHLANATMFVLLARNLGRTWFWAAVGFCAFVLFASVHLAWHYAIDGYFSILSTVALWSLMGRILRARREA